MVVSQDSNRETWRESPSSTASPKFPTLFHRWATFDGDDHNLYHPPSRSTTPATNLETTLGLDRYVLNPFMTTHWPKSTTPMPHRPSPTSRTRIACIPTSGFRRHQPRREAGRFNSTSTAVGSRSATPSSRTTTTRSISSPTQHHASSWRRHTG